MRGDVRTFYDDTYYGRAARSVIEFRRFFHYHKKKGGGQGYYLDILGLMGVRNPVSTERSLLDVACGPGMLLAKAHELGLKGYGVDFSLKALEASKLGTNKNQVVLADVDEGLPFPSDQFDYVTCLGSFEHFRNQELVVAEMTRVSKKGAILCFHVPNKNFFLSRFGYKDNQPVFTPLTYSNYLILVEKCGLRVHKVLKDNSYLYNLRYSSSLSKFLLKLLARPFLFLIPFRYSEGFIFVLSNSKSK